MNLAPQMAGQCAVLVLRRRRGLRLRLLYRSHGLCGGLEPFQLELELFDVAMEFFRLAPEVHAPQLGDDQLQMFDLGVEACHERLHRCRIQCV